MLHAIPDGSIALHQPSTHRVVPHVRRPSQIWIWDELLSGMNVGGRRRVVVPLTAMSPTQAACFPPEESVRVDLDLVRICTVRTKLAWRHPFPL